MWSTLCLFRDEHGAIIVKIAAAIKDFVGATDEDENDNPNFGEIIDAVENRESGGPLVLFHGDESGR